MASRNSALWHSNCLSITVLQHQKGACFVLVIDGLDVRQYVESLTNEQLLEVLQHHEGVEDAAITFAGFFKKKRINCMLQLLCCKTVPIECRAGQV